VAWGVFAPGHLGELTRIVPFEMVDEVLAETGAVQQRLRKLPSRVVVYLLLAAGLFEGLGYVGVWRKLVAGLGGLAVASPSGTGLWHARVRVGVKPLEALFDLLRGPACSALTAGTRWCGLLVAAIDGTVLDVPDTPGNLSRLGRHSSQHGGAGYPQIRLVALVACGTRAIIDAVFGPKTAGETTQGLRLTRSLHQGMLVLLDRGFSGNDFLAAVAATGADLLARLSAGRRPPMLGHLRDGSYLSLIGGVRVRIIECEITIATTTGRHTGIYRLGTTLLDHQRFPALSIVTLYHERWEIETCYLEIKSTLLGRRVLRSASPALIAQEIYALLTIYQTVRIAISDAAQAASNIGGGIGSGVGVDPDRASFTIAVQTARDLIAQAANVIADTTIDLVGRIGQQVLNNLMPHRRLRVSPRTVKRPLSRYAYKSLRISRTTYKATLAINILTGQTTLTRTADP